MGCHALFSASSVGGFWGSFWLWSLWRDRHGVGNVRMWVAGCVLTTKRLLQYPEANGHDAGSIRTDGCSVRSVSSYASNSILIWLRSYEAMDSDVRTFTSRLSLCCLFVSGLFPLKLPRQVLMLSPGKPEAQTRRCGWIKGVNFSQA